MRVLVTGSDGHIGQVLVPLLQAAGHEVVGLDSQLYAGCDFPGLPQPSLRTIVKDIRSVERGVRPRQGTNRLVGWQRRAPAPAPPDPGGQATARRQGLAAGADRPSVLSRRAALR